MKPLHRSFGCGTRRKINVAYGFFVWYNTSKGGAFMNSENTQSVLTIRNLSKSFGSRLVLNNISLDVYQGEIFGFLGPNGSGKTTTIKLMLGLLRIDMGSISICGHDVIRDFEGAMEKVGGIIENPEMYKYLTGYENLKQYARMCGEVPDERIDEVVRTVRLEDRINDKLSKYSLGMRQRLGVAQALLNRPRLLVLDEPTNGLDPAGIKELRDILKYISHTEGTAVFISSHQLAELDLMCDRVAIIDRGNLVAVKSIDEIRNANKDGIETFYIDAPDAEAAIQLITSLGNGAELSDGRVLVTADLNAGGKSMSEVIKALSLADIAVTGAELQKRSLEDAFLQYTRGNITPGGSV